MLAATDVVGYFSGADNVDVNQQPIVYEFPEPRNFQGTYNFQMFTFAGASVNLTGNILLHIEFHCL